MNGNDNLIFRNSTGRVYGFYKDLREGLVKQVEEFTEQENWEMVKTMADLLLDMNAWADNDNMLVLSDNNGMGYTIKEYEKGD